MRTITNRIDETPEPDDDSRTVDNTLDVARKWPTEAVDGAAKQADVDALQTEVTAGPTGLTTFRNDIVLRWPGPDDDGQAYDAKPDKITTFEADLLIEAQPGSNIKITGESGVPTGVATGSKIEIVAGEGSQGGGQLRLIGGIGNAQRGGSVIIEGGDSTHVDRDGGDVDIRGGTGGSRNGYVWVGTFDTDQVHLGGAATEVAFHGATPVAKQTVTGSRGGNAALASLLTALANLGLIVDSTTA